MTRSLIQHLRPLSTIALPITQPQHAHLSLCNQRIQELSPLSRVDDARLVFDQMPHRDALSWNSMINCYSQSGRLREVQSLLDQLGGKNVRTWTALLTEYAKHGRIEDAQALFEYMPERNVVSWNAMVSGYVKNGDLVRARKLFDEIPDRNVASWITIITGYCHHGRMREARELFCLMREKNIASYMVMISGYVEVCQYHDAWNIFLMMNRNGVRPDQSIFALGLSAVTSLDMLFLLESLRATGVKMGFEGDVVVGTSLLNGYTGNGRLDLALRFFETMPVRNDYSWTSIIMAFSRHGRLDNAIELYERIPQPSVPVQTTMITAYAQNGRIHEARLLFDSITNPTVVTWNAMFAGYAHNGMPEEAKRIFQKMPIISDASFEGMISGFVQSGQSKNALELFSEIHRTGFVPNNSGLTSALSACADIGYVEMGRQIHTLTIKMRCQFNSYVGNGLISMYGKCTAMESVAWDFSKMTIKGSMLRGCKNIMLDNAWTIFERMAVRDVVTWSAIISAYEQAGKGGIALELFLKMLAGGIRPNQLTVTSLLRACGQIGVTRIGEQIHCLIFKLGLDLCLFVSNALMTMYFNCGCLEGLSVFEEMPQRDTISWNLVLRGCAHNGLDKKAIELFEQMEKEEVLPNEISFVGILSACSHSGLVDKGWAYFNSMIQNYGITPSVYHYTCMVDLLGRTGQVSEAEALIENMPEKPDAIIWESLLGACRMHCHFELGQKVAKKLFDIGTQNSGTYILLSNMYASQCMWDKVQEIRELMRNQGVTKVPGVSQIYIRNELHRFLMGDKTHDQMEEIHSTLNDLYVCCGDTVYVPNI